jgi:hypothetical protein
MFGSVYIKVTGDREHDFHIDNNGKLLVAPWSYFGM